MLYPLRSHLHLLLLLLLISSSSITTIAASSSSSATPIGNGYRLISVDESSDGALIGHLQVNHRNNIYGPDIPLLRLYVKHETDARLRVHITDAQQQRWEVPYNLLPREKPSKQTAGRSRENPITATEYVGSELIFSYITDPFSFAVKRKSNGETLFDSASDYNSLVFKDQYLEISTSLPKDASLYGLGENTQPHGIKLYPNDPYTLWTTDQSAINLNMDLYGSHPVYMDLRNVGGEANAHGVLLLNSNGMDVLYRGSSLTYKVIGGVLDFYFFSGPSPLAVVDQYTQLIGRPAPMPYWSLASIDHSLTPWAEKIVHRRLKKSLTWRVYPISRDVYEVVAGRNKATVDMRVPACTCNKMQKSGLPCGHAIAALRHNNVDDCSPWVQPWFRIETYRAAYAELVYPVGSPTEWEYPEEVMTVKPPIMQKRQAGRPRNRDRIPSRGEEPIRKTCSNCQMTGHTRNNCPTPLPAADVYARSGHASGGQMGFEDWSTFDLNDPS